MSSNEEYLENLLQSMIDGKVASPSKKDVSNSGRQKSAIEMLTGEEPVVPHWKNMAWMKQRWRSLL